MNATPAALAPGLYMVATPIGNARDITLRAMDVLRDADLLAAEDTRSLRRLMEIHGIALRGRQVVAYHDHNGPRARPGILRALAEGKSVAYASEAGTPLIADPGFDLVREAAAAGHPVTTAPGVTALATAATLAGLPTDRLLFAGFLPSAGSGRRKALRELAGVPATLVFYESPKRTAAFLEDALAALGDRQAAICRELTKTYEEIRRGTITELAERQTTDPVRGEVVIVVSRGNSETVSEVDLDSALREALQTMSVRDAADMVSGALNLPRRQVYQQAMKVKRDAPT